MNSLSGLLRESIARHAAAGRTALAEAIVAHSSIGRRPLSYAELGTLIDRYAGAAHAWGIRRGELVGIVAGRSAEAVALFFGIMQAGGCPCFMEPKLSAGAVAMRMKAVGMRRLAMDRDVDGMAETLRSAGMDVATLSRNEGHFIDEGLGPTDRAMMQFTSGSTGQPKGVLLTHGNLLCNARGIIAHTEITPADRLLHVMPLHHTNGMNNQLVAPFIAGASVVLAAKFRAEEIEAQIDEYGVTYMTGVPTMYSRIIPHLRDRARLDSLRMLRCGSAPITVALHEQIEAAFGVPLVVSYGLSEATCTSTMNPPGARRLGSVGTVLSGQQVGLFEPGTAEKAPAGSEGEIRISGPCVMAGYIGAGAEQPIVDGWLCTGDLGRFDEDGYLAITGRIKDVIIRGGENLSPQLIEGVLVQHPAVRSCCVVGGPHADLGEVPVAFVMLRDGGEARDEELKALVGERLSRIYIPAEIRFVDALPENSVGKVDRKALKKVLEAKFGAS